jgi:SAM-dependent methyltransferase
MVGFELTAPRRCDVCDGDDFEILGRLRTGRIPALSLPVAMCRTCGFVTQRPRLTSADYKRVNQLWYTHKFAADPPTDASERKKFSKWSLMWDRIQPWYPHGPSSLLDVGAGQGWAIEFLKGKFPGMAATAIEQWPPCQDYIRGQLGAEVVDIDISADWPSSLHNRFDLIIFRHTIEHLEEPLAALTQIAAALAPGGHCYLVTPNAMFIHPGQPILTDYFRPVHLHYFNADTLSRLAARAGLIPTVIDSQGELWGLFRRPALGEAAAAQGCVTPAEQRAFLRRRMADARGTDYRRLLRMALRRVMAIFSHRPGA